MIFVKQKLLSDALKVIKVLHISCVYKTLMKLNLKEVV